VNHRMAPETGLGLLDHPLRRQVVGEMQLRRFPALSVPARIVQIVRLVEDRAAERAALLTLWPGLAPDARHAEARLDGGLHLGWERHSEASTMTLMAPGEGWHAPLHAGLIEAVPGTVVRASRLTVVADDAAARGALATADFAPAQLVTCHLRSPAGGRARMWTDFRIHADGYGRMVVAANGMAPGDLGRCVQQVQELGNYRNLALIGLPPAREAWARLDGLEGELEAAGQALALGEARDDDLLALLTGLSARLLSIDSACAYRMSATAAYARIVADRLARLDAEPIAGFPSLDDFIGRRFHPAIHTCAALTERLALLNRRAAQSTALLRTRVETHIENQNARLLTSMDTSARMQLRLQHLVEGLSCVAISYYLLGLLAYPLKAAEKQWTSLSSVLLLGVLAPVILLVVMFSLKHARHRMVSDDKPPSSRP
jgi:uncharacterized membrane-anchored protein